MSTHISMLKLLVPKYRNNGMGRTVCNLCCYTSPAYDLHAPPADCDRTTKLPHAATRQCNSQQLVLHSHNEQRQVTENLAMHKVLTSFVFRQTRKSTCMQTESKGTRKTTSLGRPAMSNNKKFLV
jgi:hypothetical protein